MLEFLSQSTWADRIGWMLVHSLWQFALLVVLAVALQWALRRCAPVTRYRALMAAMGIMVALPVVTWFSLGSADAPSAAVAFHSAEPPDEAPRSQHSYSSPSQRRESVSAKVAVPIQSPIEPRVARQQEPQHVEPAPIGSAGPFSLVQRHVQPWLPEIVLIWFAGVLVAALRPLLSWYTVGRLRTVGVSPVGDAVQVVVERTAARLGFARSVKVLQSTLVKAPVVIGYFRPVILLPLCVLTGLSESQLELILAHELAHIRRHDYLINLLQTLVETLFFYHPGVWWLSRQIRYERENCCDDVAMATVGNRADYGRALLAVEQLRATSTTLSLAARGGSLVKRMRRIAGCEPAPRLVGGGSILCIILVSFAVFAGVTWGTAPATEKPEQAAAAPRDAAAEPDASETSVQSDALAPADASAEGANDDSSQDAAEGQPFKLFDSFDGKLELDWEVTRPDPTHVSLEKNPGRLTITSQLGGLFQGKENGAGNNMHMIPNPAIGGGDFVVTTCLEQFHPEKPFQQAGPHIYDDDDNYLKAIIARSERSVLIGSSWETRGRFGGRDQIAEDIEWERLWLRIIKRGRAYESSYSLDGEEFTVIAERVWGDGSPQKIGLAVMNEDGTSAPLDAAFDFFEVRSLTDEEKNDPVSLERQKLQGIWQVVSARLGGKAMEKSLWSRFEFHGIEATFSEEGAGFTSKYVPHPEKEPKELELTGLGRELWRNHTRAFRQDRNLMNAIYSIEQDRLLICIDPRQGAPAPTALETKEGDGRLLLELQRIPEVEIAALSRNLRSNKEFVDWLDVDHDEQLTIEEFTSDWPTPAAIDRARKVFGLVDQNQDGHVTFDEFRTRPDRATSLLLDRDLDDKLTFDELSSGPMGKILPNRRRRIFQLLDKNDDGTLTHEEHAARSAEYWFVKLDVNDNNRMSLSEYSAGNPALVRNGRIQRVFSAIDRDGNGNVSLEEFADRPQEAIFDKSDANADKELSFKEFAVWQRGPEEIAAAEKDFARKDTDGNGALSFKEYAFRGEDEGFWKADQNGDNRLNRDEFEASQIWAAAGDQMAAFKSLDQNRDGNICLSEFRNRPDSD